MARGKAELDLEQELLLLKLWAVGVDITRKLTAEQIRSVPGLATVIESISVLPGAIGWDEETGASTGGGGCESPDESTD